MLNIGFHVAKNYIASLRVEGMEIVQDEAKDTALFEYFIPSDKAPGPDGFTGLFYERCTKQALEM